jgi:hypothetical protein
MHDAGNALLAQRRDFSIIFRTFGADICEVIDEMNMFATGQHPCYPEVRPLPSK